MFYIQYKTNLSYCRKIIFLCISSAIILLLIYSNSFNCSWHFDDIPNIIGNDNVRLNSINLNKIKKAIFSDPKTPNFPRRPISCLTFALNYYFDKDNVFGYHVVNLLVHWLSSVFLFLFLYHTLNLPKLKYKYGINAYDIALLATIFWAINPVQVQAVTYIVQRMASLAGLFYIMSMYFYVKARTNQYFKRSFLFFGFCILTFLLAIGSKENAVMLPIVIFVYEALLIQNETSKFIKSNIYIIVIVVSFTLLIGIFYLYFKKGNVLYFLESYDTIRPFSLKERLLTEPRVIFFYFSLLIYPITNRLNIAHYFELSQSIVNPIVTLIAIVGIIIVLIVAIYLIKKAPLVSYCILFYFINHIIESSIFPLEIAYEHRNYIPSMLLFVPIAVGLKIILNLYNNRFVIKTTIFLFISLFMVGLGHATYLRNFDWKNSRQLWGDAVKKSPDIFRPYHNLAKEYQISNQTDKALSLYQIALTKYSNNRKNEKFITFFNLGNLYKNKDEFEKAKHYYKMAINMNSMHSPTYNNLAMIFDREGKHDLSRDYLIKALKIYPNDPTAHLNLANYYLKNLKPEKAQNHLKKVVSSGKYLEKALLYLGISYKQMKLYGKSAITFEKALKNTRRKIIIYLHLSEVYERAGFHDRALKKLEKVIDVIDNKRIYDKIVSRLTMSEQDANVYPNTKIVYPLLVEALGKKGTIINKRIKSLKENIRNVLTVSE